MEEARAKAQILVVDDDSSVARTIEAILQSLGYTVPAIASSGAEAIKKVGDVQPDLVLMDIRLEGDIDGVQAAEQIRNHFDVPVVYITACADEETLQRAKVTEPYGYILKPFRDFELLTAVEIAIYKHKVERENVWLKREISQRRQAEKALEASKANLHNIVERNADSMLIVDRSGIVHFANPAAELLFNHKAKDLLGAQFGFPAVADETTEIDIIKKSGETAVAEMRVVETEWEGEIAYLASLRDITERKRAQEAKFNELESLTYSIAHDLRSPLISIQGLLSYLREDIQNQEIKMVQEDIGLLESGVRKMEQLVKGTLEYFRTGYLVKPDERIPFREIAEEVLKILAIQFGSIGATISLAKTFPMVYVDRMRIMQVVSNLIQNSIDYRDRIRPLTIEIGHWLSEDEDVLFVRDNGIGIDASETEKIFGLFYRGTADGEGSGASLAIVRRILEAHGGRIWVQQSQPGKGTTMCFALPQQRGTNKVDNNGKD